MAATRLIEVVCRPSASTSPSLREHGDFTPVVEYLTAIQSLRGEASSLMFVRGADLDAMAERNGRPVPEFLDRLDQLGVIVSNN